MRTIRKINLFFMVLALLSGSLFVPGKIGQATTGTILRFVRPDGVDTSITVKNLESSLMMINSLFCDERGAVIETASIAVEPLAYLRLDAIAFPAGTATVTLEADRRATGFVTYSTEDNKRIEALDSMRSPSSQFELPLFSSFDHTLLHVINFGDAEARIKAEAFDRFGVVLRTVEAGRLAPRAVLKTSPIMLFPDAEDITHIRFSADQPIDGIVLVNQPGRDLVGLTGLNQPGVNFNLGTLGDDSVDTTSSLNIINPNDQVASLQFVLKGVADSPSAGFELQVKPSAKVALDISKADLVAYDGALVMADQPVLAYIDFKGRNTTTGRAAIRLLAEKAVTTCYHIVGEDGVAAFPGECEHSLDPADTADSVNKPLSEERTRKTVATPLTVTPVVVATAEPSIAQKIAGRNPLAGSQVTVNFLCHGSGANCTGTIRPYVAGRIHTGEDRDHQYDGQIEENKVRAPLPGVVAVTPVSSVTCTNCSGLGNNVVLAVLLEDGKYALIHTGHMLYTSGRQAADLARNDRVVSGQFIGYKGQTGAAQGTHLHVEVSNTTTAASTAECASHWRPACIGSRRTTPATGSVQVENPSPYLTTAKKALIPYLSTTSQTPSFDNYQVFGVASSPLYASITIRPPQAVTMTNVGVGGRLYTNDVANYDLFNFSSASFGAAETRTFRGSRSGLQAGDYKFFAYINTTQRGYPLKVTILPNRESRIIDNESLVGYSADSASAEDTAGYFLTGALFRGGNVTNYAEWRPGLSSGEYEIYVHVPAKASAQSVSYTISPDGSSLLTSTAISHAGNEDRWVRLSAGGRSTFAMTPTGYVQLSNSIVRATPAAQRVGADAVKFVYIGGQPSGTPSVTSFAINGGAANTSSQTVRLDNQTSGSPTQYMASESASFTGAAWQSYSSSPSFTLGLSAGVHTVYFKVRNSSGNESAAASDAINFSPTSSGSDAASFVQDVTIPDDTVMSPGQGFQKVWRFNNTGSTTWGNGYSLVFTRGAQLSTQSSVSIPATTPGSSADIGVAMTAPSTPGTYQSYWRLRNPSGQLFGPEVWVRIRVEGTTPSPMASFTMSGNGASAGQGQTLSYLVSYGGNVRMRFDGSASRAGSGSITDYIWTSNGTEIGRGPVIEYTFGHGRHDIRLTVRDSAGQTANASGTVIVREIRLTGMSPSSPRAGTSDQDITVFGEELQNVTRIHVNFPGGGGGTLHAPGQVFRQSYNSLVMRITLGGRGTWAIQAVSSGGQVSNILIFTVN